MSQNALISIKNPIMDAMEMLRVDHTAFTPLFTRWAEQAETDIGSYYQYVKKREVIEIDNCIAKLPKDCVFLQRAILGDLGCDCGDLFDQVCSTITSAGMESSLSGFLIVDLVSGTTGVRGFLSHVVQGNKIILNTADYDGQKITIQYLGYELDCDGFMSVGENHVQAIMWNIMWKYYMQKQDISPMEYGKMKDCKLEWNRECSHARAKDGELTESERQKIVGMLHDAYIGVGLSVGMKTTLDNTWNIY